MVSVGTVRGRTAAPPIEVACQTESRMAGAVGAVGWTLELAPVWVEPTRLVTMTTGWAGASGLTYDPASDQYNYVWKTEKGWAGQCRLLSVRLADGSVHSALFKFK